MRLAILALATAGCYATSSEIGPPSRELCIDADSDPDHAVSFASQVSPLFSRDDVHCVRCHTPTGMNPIGVALSGLDLSTYDTLRRGGTRSGADIVIAGQPCESILVQKLSNAPPFGARMPLDGPPDFDDPDRQLIFDWIAEGALDDRRRLAVFAIIVGALGACLFGRTPTLVIDDPAVPAELRSACDLAALRCLRCHTVDRILQRTHVDDEAHWAARIHQMRLMPESGIGSNEEAPILRCMIYQAGPVGLARGGER